ncbi:MAG TPA: FtsW/RodA/SpoVE family cell cycle protein [Candidatus Paceibacterota bacterium]|nr:FtsW/RodA/SpoVE family cell cycle protein [Candidatus Paceibacterota bacterium]
MVDMIKSAGERIAKGGIDWIMLSAAIALGLFGLVTMNSFVGDNYYFSRQIIWLCVAVGTFFGASFIDWSFLRRTNVLMTIYCVIIAVLGFLLVAAKEVKGAQSWLHFGTVSFEPMDAAKLALVLILAKYFSKRHIEIANIRHILVSGAYTFVLFVLVALQPDFGSAVIIGCVWLGMALASGISKRHLAILFSCAAIAFALLWNFGFQEYQKLRIMNFVHPTADVQGTGYNARQSTIAVGSGEILGKGIGYGTQSKLKFLPEYQTDFIFAAFAEEWGFIGVIIFFATFGVLIWRIIANARRGATNFEIFYGLGLSVLFMSHFLINVGMNMGVLPVTGITLPFVSYGGSHLLTSFLALGILQSYRKSMRAVHREETKNEFLGI